MSGFPKTLALSTELHDESWTELQGLHKLVSLGGGCTPAVQNPSPKKPRLQTSTVGPELSRPNPPGSSLKRERGRKIDR